MKRPLFILFFSAVLGGSFLFAADLPQGEVAIYSDSHDGNAVHEQIANTIILTKAKAVFHCGDFVSDRSNPQDWQPALQIIDKLRKYAEFFPATGNWDAKLPSLLVNLPMLDKVQWYSLDREGIHFVVLNSNAPLDSQSVQYKWLEEDLSGADGKNRFVIVLLHYPIFSTGYHPQGSQRLRFALTPLFEKYGVDAVFSGHDHHYERSSYHGIYYIVTGGGGGILHGQTRESPYSEFFITENHFCLLTKQGQNVVVKVLDTSFNALDEFVLGEDSEEGLEPDFPRSEAAQNSSGTGSAKDK